MSDILKMIVSVLGVSGGVVVIFYFLFSLGASDFNNFSKIPVNDKVLKAFANVILATYILIIIMFSISKQINSNNMMTITDILTVVYAVGYYVFIYVLNNKIKKIYDRDDYSVNKKHIGLIICIAFTIIISTGAIMIDNKNMKFIDHLVQLFNKYDYNEAKDFFIILLQIIINYSVMMLLTGYMHGLFVSYNLKKYIISSEVFEEGRAIGYIIGESKDEIMLKSEGSYPIAIRKANITGYIVIPNDIKVEENENNIIFKNKNGEEINYKGYLAKVNSKLDN